MACPRCDSDLTALALDGRRAVVCEACGYVGIATDHRSAGRETESWEEALDRFRRRRSG